MGVQNSYPDTMSQAFEGMLYDVGENDVITMKNQEVSAEMAFGRALAFEGGSDDQGALLPDDPADVLCGILLHSHDYAQPEELGDDGVLPGARLNVLRKGRVWVRCASGCAVGDRLFVRQDISGGGSEAEGALENALDTDNIDATAQGVWLTSAAAGELAVLEVDFTNKP